MSEKKHNNTHSLENHKKFNKKYRTIADIPLSLIIANECKISILNEEYIMLAYRHNTIIII